MAQFEEIRLANFKIGQAIQARYSNASTGTMGISWWDANSNVVFEFIAHFATKEFWLNHVIDGNTKA